MSKQKRPAAPEPVVPDALAVAADAQASMEASAQPGPRIELHRETDGSLHVVIRCPSQPTEIMSIKAFGSQDELVSEYEDRLIRHELLAGCDCRDSLPEALRVYFEGGGTV